jgi:hypothetical protein
MMGRLRLGVCVFLSAFILEIGAIPAVSQEVTARLQGTVTNTSGSVVPGVNLTAANVSTGMVTPVTSDAPGYYIFPSLVAGTPHSSRQSPDFHTFIMNGLISG